MNQNSLFGALGPALLILMASGCDTREGGTTGPEGLSGTAWVAEDIQGRGVIDMLQSTLEFQEPGQVGGNAGCNRYFGSVSLHGNEVTFGQLGSTRKMCAPAIMDQEQKFLAALEAVRTWEIRNGLLYLRDAAQDAVLRFSAKEVPATP